MTDSRMKIPGPDHPIIIERNPSRIVIALNGETLGDTRNALALREMHYPAVQYIPRADFDMSKLTRSAHTTYCPYKGECAYYSLPAGAKNAENAVWTYENPYDAVASIKEHLAFYTDRVELTEQAG